MSHRASSAGLSYLGTHHSPDWFDDNVSVKGLRFSWLLFVVDVHALPYKSRIFLVTETMQTSSMHVMLTILPPVMELLCQHLYVRYASLPLCRLCPPQRAAALITVSG